VKGRFVHAADVPAVNQKDFVAGQQAGASRGQAEGSLADEQAPIRLLAKVSADASSFRGTREPRKTRRDEGEPCSAH
jgi:hypothetical protein